MNEHKRVKTGHTPGDIAQRHLIALQEKKPVSINYGGGYIYEYGEKASKALRTYLKEKSRPVQRQRDKKAIQKGLQED